MIMILNYKTIIVNFILYDKTQLFESWFSLTMQKAIKFKLLK